MSIRERLATAMAMALALAVAGCGGPGGEGSAPEGTMEPEARQEPAATAEAPPADEAPGAADAAEIMPGLSMRVLEEGNGPTAEPGQTAVVHYTGWLYDASAPENRGQKFDSSVDRGQPFQFTLGAGQVIRGWDEGVRGMQVGESRELTIAPELAYGERDMGAIPPGSTLVFEVELLDLKESGAARH